MNVPVAFQTMIWTSFPHVANKSPSAENATWLIWIERLYFVTTSYLKATKCIPELDKLNCVQSVSGIQTEP